MGERGVHINEQCRRTFLHRHLVKEGREGSIEKRKENADR